MRNTFAALDDALIEGLFQPAANLVRHRLGVRRETFACFCIDLASLWWIASRTPGLSGAVLTWDAGTAFADIALLLLGLVALIGLRTLFRRAANTWQNPLRSAMRRHRAIVLLMLTADLVQSHAPGLASAADIAMLVSAASALYLGACSEPPPMRPGRRALAGASAPPW